MFVCVYTCTQIFPVLFAKLGEDCYSSELVFDCLKKMVYLVAEHVRGEFTAPLWTALLVREKESKRDGGEI